MRKKVIVAGHICLDITPKFPDSNIRNAAAILQPGHLLQVGNADIHTGGTVANTGLAMKFLGADVTLMGKLGTDAWGDIVMNQLSSQDAAQGMIRDPNEMTSYSIVLAMPGIDRIFLHNPGANNTYKATDVPESALKESALLHFGYPPIMRSMYIHEGAELETLLKKAKTCGCMTSLDMAAIDPSSEAGAADWNRILQNVLPYTDFFMPSAEELCYMLDRPRYEEWMQRADGRDFTEILDPIADIRPLAHRCIELGAKIVLVKCGASGIYYKTASTSLLQSLNLHIEDWADREGFESSYVPTEIISGTGAGDTCIAAFLTAMLNGESLDDCLHLAAAEGASCVAAIDALSGLKTLDELKVQIAKGWPKVCCNQ